MIKSKFGTLENGDSVSIFTLRNKSGMEVKITNYGAIITSIKVPDKNGNYGNVVLGFDNLKQYELGHPYFGAIIGRYANRIGGAQFSLNGQTYTLAKNNGENCLHGGLEGFDKKIWEAKEFENNTGSGVVLKYVSPDGEEGFPGTLTCEVAYTLTEDNEIKINYLATTDKTTILNLTNHSYFNLKDGGRSPVLNHELVIHSDRITPTDEFAIPTGHYMDVVSTPFDFSEAHTIGERINSDHEQLQFGKGYDHNFVLEDGKELKSAATVFEPESGRFLEVFTTEPGIQFYTGNYLGTASEGEVSVPFDYRTGFCLETQHFPDSPNQPEFPSVVLNPGESFISTTIYKFSVIKD